MDSFHGFTIRYVAETNDSEITDKDLSKHMDQSDITLNLCLYNDDKTESKVFFQGIRGDPDSEKGEDHVEISMKPI